MVLRYRPRRLRCARCGVHVEAVPWARLWARVTTTLARAVAELARHLRWQQTARHFRLDWKSVATIVRRVVAYGLERRRRRSATVQVVCLDMWQASLNAVQHHAPNAQVLFDRFHLVQHLNRALDEVRRREWRRLSGREKTSFKRTRFLLLKNPWNLTSDERERLSTLVRWNSPIERAYYLKEVFQLFWTYRQPARAAQHLRRWMHSALRSRLGPFKELVRPLRAHLDGVLAWTRLWVSNGALEGMNNKIKLVSHRSFGFRHRFPNRRELHRRDLSLLCASPFTGGALITLWETSHKTRGSHSN